MSPEPVLVDHWRDEQHNARLNDIRLLKCSFPKIKVPTTMRNAYPSERIAGYDVARALAIFGMVVHHFVIAMAREPARPPSFKLLMKLFDGRPAVLFLILAGIGITLRSRQACASFDATAIAQERRALSKRGVMLLILGFLNLVIWPGDILRVYGVSLLIAAPLITESNRRLLVVSSLFVIGFGVLICSLDYEQNWDWTTMNYHHLWTLSGSLRSLFCDGFRPVFPFGGFVIFGMWLGRLDLQDRRINDRVLKISLGIMLGAEVVSAIIVGLLSSDQPSGWGSPATIQACFGTESMPPFPLFLAAAGGTAIATIALCVRLKRSESFLSMTAILAPTGRMALTWYFAHIYFGLGTIVAMNAIGNQSTLTALLTGILFFFFAVILSWIWSRHFKSGPLEWGMRLFAV